MEKENLIIVFCIHSNYGNFSLGNPLWCFFKRNYESHLYNSNRLNVLVQFFFFFDNRYYYAVKEKYNFIHFLSGM